MRTIFKYQLNQAGAGKTILKIPAKAEFLSTQIQNGTICMWFFIPDSDKEKQRREFIIYGTGWQIPNNAKHRGYFGTIQIEQGQLVWHIFELEPKT